MAVAPVTIEPLHPGASSKVPAWANWARPRRGPGHRQRGDAIYLAREDGLIYYTVASYTDTRIQLSHAANFGCHVGTAFACLGDSGDPDILAVPGEMSRGGIWTVSHQSQYATPGADMSLDWLVAWEKGQHMSTTSIAFQALTWTFRSAT